MPGWLDGLTLPPALPRGLLGGQLQQHLHLQKWGYLCTGEWQLCVCAGVPRPVLPEALPAWSLRQTLRALQVQQPLFLPPFGRDLLLSGRMDRPGLL